MSEKVIFECISKVMQNDMESIIKSFPLIGELKKYKNIYYWFDRIVR